MSRMHAQLELSQADASVCRPRSPLAQLVHALNQPLTGLQCSLELAVAGPRPTEEYVRVLREALDLSGRVRTLVEAMRELEDTYHPDLSGVETFALDELLRATAGELLPVALAQKSQIRFITQAPQLVQANRCSMQALVFRFLESSLSLTREGGTLEVAAIPEDDASRITVSWEPKAKFEHSCFSQSELGLLIVQARWEQLGARWARLSTGNRTICTVRIPLASSQGMNIQTGDPQ